MIDDLIKAVEDDAGIDTAAMISSGLSVFTGALRRNENMIALKNALVAAGGSGTEKVRDRIFAMLDQKVDARFGNEKCSHIGALLFVLRFVDKKFAALVAEEVLKRGVNLWWSKGIAQELVSPEKPQYGMPYCYFLMLTKHDGSTELVEIPYGHHDDMEDSVKAILLGLSDEKRASIKSVKRFDGHAWEFPASYWETIRKEL
jgi:hypothetical protein